LDNGKAVEQSGEIMDDDEEAVKDDYDFGTAFKYDMKEVESNMDEEEESAR
jgi:hypothetical protein